MRMLVRRLPILTMRVCVVVAGALLYLCRSVSADCNACPQGSSSCPTTASIDAQVRRSYSNSCDNPNYRIVVNAIEVGQGDGDGDDFTVTVMDENEYNKFQEGGKYVYYTAPSTGGVGDGSGATCFQYTGPITSSAGNTLYTVIMCTNLLETCHLRLKLDVTCVNLDPCAGVNCNNGYCSSGDCVCNSGYYGLYCDQDPCSGMDCSGNGNCVNGTCSCYEGYWGPSCSHSCSNAVCLNGGICVSSARGCQCQANYEGSDCSQYTGTMDILPFHASAREFHGSSDSSEAPIVAIICSCVGAAVLLVVVMIAAVLYRRSRRQRAEALSGEHQQVHLNNRGTVPLVVAMEQQ